MMFGEDYAYAVARIEEALTLRSGGIVKPVIMLEGFFSAEDLPVLAANSQTICVRSELPSPVTVLALVSRIQVNG